MAIDIDFDKALGGKYLKGADFVDGAQDYVIEDVTEVTFSSGESKYALKLVGEEKLATLGPSNLRALREGLGEPSSTWPGKGVILMAGNDYQGKPSLVIRPIKAKSKPGVKVESAAADVAFSE